MMPYTYLIPYISIPTTSLPIHTPLSLMVKAVDYDTTTRDHRPYLCINPYARLCAPDGYVSTVGLLVIDVTP